MVSMMRSGPGGMPTWYAPRHELCSCIDSGDWSVGCYLMMRPLPLALAFPAPVDVILLVCMSSPIYLSGVSRRAGVKEDEV